MLEGMVADDKVDAGGGDGYLLAAGEDAGVARVAGRGDGAEGFRIFVDGDDGADKPGDREASAGGGEIEDASAGGKSSEPVVQRSSL